MKSFNTAVVGVFAARLWLGFLGLWLVGCQSPDSGGSELTAGNPESAVAGAATATADRLRVGDRISVVFSDIPAPPAPFVMTVRDDGSVTLHLNLTFTVAGKRATELEKEIYEAYVPKYYKNLTVSVKQDERFYFVDGEVKMAGQKIYTGEMNVLKAISASGGFTDFANRKNVEVIRANGDKVRVNCVKARSAPEENKSVFPGDTIIVHRRFI